MEKPPMYAVMTPPGEGRRQWVAWMAAFLSLIALVVAVVTACVAVQQFDRVTDVEEKMLEMKLHFEHLLSEYEYEYDDPETNKFQELVLQSVIRKKREAATDESDEQNGGVPIYDQAYGVDLNPRSHGMGFRLYGSLLDPDGLPISPETTGESTIKPYNRISNWALKEKRQRNELSSRPRRLRNRHNKKAAAGGSTAEEDAEIIRPASASYRRQPVLQRESRVKATERANPRVNSVVPQPQPVLQPVVPQTVPQPVSQTQQRPEALKSRPLSTLRRQDGLRKKKLRVKHRRRRAITVAHFVATPANRSAHHHGMSGEVHEEWSPAAWMDKLALNRKYSLKKGVVTVKEPGLYYVYAQVLYEPGRFGSGFQVIVDGIPIMECSLAPAQPSHSCHTGGATYLPRNAAVYIRDREHHMTAVKDEKNSFFGLMKLMDAPDTAEELLLG